MIRHFLPVFALLLGSSFLLFAGGINGLILPVRGSAEGFSAFSLGLLGTGWAIGYMAGCVLTPRLVANVGHVRAFGAMAAIAAVSMLGSAIMLTPWAWIALRGVCGFCFAGAAMIVESWLSDQAAPDQRGRIFGVYTMVNLGAVTAGQMTLTLGDTSGFLFFAIGAIFYCLALVPTALSSSSNPAPLVAARLDMKALWRNSPVAVFAVFWVGVSNSAFGTLAAVYAERTGLVLAAIAFFTSLPILAGALAAAILGGSIFAMYPVIVAHANDHAAPGTSIQISGGLLLLYGAGGIVGPLMAGWAMTSFADRALFMVTAVAHVLVILYTLWRISRRVAVDDADKTAFQVAPGGRGSTPQTAALGASEAEVQAEADTATAP